MEVNGSGDNPSESFRKGINRTKKFKIFDENSFEFAYINLSEFSPNFLVTSSVRNFFFSLTVNYRLNLFKVDSFLLSASTEKKNHILCSLT